MELVGWLALIIGAYLLGAIPWGVVLGRIRGVDVRKSGSGSTGATNTLRLMGWKFAVTVFVLDFAKGMFPVLLARALDAPDWVIAVTAVVPVIGHCWSPYIGFQGGKGMATGGGTAVALAWWLVLLLIPMIGIVALTRYVSLASISAAIVGPAIVVVLAAMDEFPWWWALAVVALASLIIYQHRSNIGRLLNGTERKFGNREPSATNPAKPT
jgi:glycerol-3-phosphate acyltransferase PlsY